MSARILDYFGTQDGIRHGHISFGCRCARTFHFDRISQRVRLFVMNAGVSKGLEEDTDPERKRRAVAALIAHEPIHA